MLRAHGWKAAGGGEQLLRCSEDGTALCWNSENWAALFLRTGFSELDSQNWWCTEFRGNFYKVTFFPFLFSQHYPQKCREVADARVASSPLCLSFSFSFCATYFHYCEGFMAPLARSEVNDLSRGSCSDGIVSKTVLNFPFMCLFQLTRPVCLIVFLLFFIIFKKPFSWYHPFTWSRLHINRETVAQQDRSD